MPAPALAADAGTDAPWPWVAVGLTPACREDGYVLTVDPADPAAAPRVPDDVDGVRVVTEVVGVVRLL